MGLDFNPGIKDRPEKDSPESLGVSNGLNGKKRVIMTDDETASFKSCLELIRKINQSYGIDEFYVAVSHMRLSPSSLSRVKEANERYGMRVLHTTDSIPQRDELLSLSCVKMHSLDEMWAFVINKVHYVESVSELFKRGE